MAARAGQAWSKGRQQDRERGMESEHPRPPLRTEARQPEHLFSKGQAGSCLTGKENTQVTSSRQNGKMEISGAGENLLGPGKPAVPWGSGFGSLLMG